MLCCSSLLQMIVSCLEVDTYSKGANALKVSTFAAGGPCFCISFSHCEMAGAPVHIKRTTESILRF